jgi:hypothetical protein
VEGQPSPQVRAADVAIGETAKPVRHATQAHSRGRFARRDDTEHVVRWLRVLGGRAGAVVTQRRAPRS